MENGDKLNMSNSCGTAVLSKKSTFEEDEADKKGSSANADTCGNRLLAQPKTLILCGPEGTF